MVVLVYFLAYICHSLYVRHRFLQFFTYGLAAAAWSILNRANFAVVDHNQLDYHIQGLDTNGQATGSQSCRQSVGLIFKGIDMANTAHEHTSGDYNASLPGRTIPEQHKLPEDGEKERENYMRTINTLQQEEREVAVNSANEALRLIVANNIFMLGISLSTTFSIWTAPNLLDNTSAQIGSLALLTTVIGGLTALVKSTSHLSDLCNAFWHILKYKEIKINDNVVNFIQKRKHKHVSIGFTESLLTPHPVTWSQLIHGIRQLGILTILLFGPAYSLIPSHTEARENSNEISFDLELNVREHSVIFTTGSTDRHDRQGEDNIEAINVCYIGRINKAPNESSSSEV